MDLILKPIHSTIKINYLWVIRVILSFSSQGRATELSSALLICCLAVLWIPLHNKCIPLRCVPIWDFSYLLENRAIVSCVLYTLHSLNGNDSLSSFSRISAFPGCFRVFVLGGGVGVVFGLGWVVRLFVLVVLTPAAVFVKEGILRKEVFWGEGKEIFRGFT